ncbi:MAG TPA: lactate utilization protein [Pyrinomonadaceae bacterium]|nr:lactate utilization protein [Pyrinomonadaceae bacterium]
MNNAAREAILGSIRSHLAASAASDHPVHPENPEILSKGDFKESVESVDGHCIIATDVTDVLNRILADLKPRRIAISDDADVERWLRFTDLEIDELGVAPNAHDIFRFDVGISTAQAAIAETGTLILDSACERHRLVSLVPPVHIAIVNASTICDTLSDALALLRKDKEISPAVTFITGPSRTADIELTLAIGVHGPQELYVIVNATG